MNDVGLSYADVTLTRFAEYKIASINLNFIFPAYILNLLPLYMQYNQLTVSFNLDSNKVKTNLTWASNN